MRTARSILAAVMMTALLAAPAVAGVEVQLGGNLTRIDPRRHPIHTGFGGGIVISPTTPISFAITALAGSAKSSAVQSVLVGPQLGVTDGRVRPYFQLLFGGLGGNVDFGGIAAGYTAGAVGDITDALALWTELRSVNSTNTEYDGHVAEWRFGVAFGSGIGRARRR